MLYRSVGFVYFCLFNKYCFMNNVYLYIGSQGLFCIVEMFFEVYLDFLMGFLEYNKIIDYNYSRLIYEYYIYFYEKFVLNCDYFLILYDLNQIYFCNINDNFFIYDFKILNENFYVDYLFLEN